MSTVDRRPTAPPVIPPLKDGQRLGQAEFMRRYELTPPGFTAELIRGIVHVPRAPHSWLAHARSALRKNPPWPPLRKAGTTTGRTASNVPPLRRGGDAGRRRGGSSHRPWGVRKPTVKRSSPVSYDHGRPSYEVIFWLGHYEVRTPGVEGLADVTTLMDELGVPQPDVQLRILPEYGGQTRDEGEYVGGAPELVVEVAKSSRKIDLGKKRDDYERAGVKEYIIVTRDPDDVHWFVRRGKKLVKRRRDRDGLYRSKVFPGLWLDPAALLRRDLATLDRGLASPEHAAFVAKLAATAARANRNQ